MGPQYQNLAKDPRYASKLTEFKALLPKTKPAEIPGSAGNKKKQAK